MTGARMEKASPETGELLMTPYTRWRGDVLGYVTSSSESHSPSTPGWLPRLGLVAVLCFFCVPLFVGLRGWDLRNDEAIYTSAIDSILETGDWLTPRLPGDLPFLEKPPLKIWIVAAAIRTGLLPNDEFGLRFFDALFSAVSFVYVFYVGRLLAGSLCGMVAVLVLFTIILCCSFTAFARTTWRRLSCLLTAEASITSPDGSTRAPAGNGRFMLWRSARTSRSGS